MKRSRFSAVLLTGMLLSGGAVAPPGTAVAQEPVAAVAQAGCGAQGYRVVARWWDVVLGRDWELRQACAHPEWPARLVAAGSAGAGLMARNGMVRTKEVAQTVQPLLVHAGDRVRLWSQGEMVRIEMSGVVEQSAHGGDRVVVQIARHNEDAGMTVERFNGVVRGAGDVEMDR
jgi:hypothetical protein